MQATTVDDQLKLFKKQGSLKAITEENVKKPLPFNNLRKPQQVIRDVFYQ